MKPRARQLSMLFENEKDVNWLPEQAQRDLITTLADLLLDAVNTQRQGESDEPEDPR